MRILGFILVMIGALLIGYQGFGRSGDEPEAAAVAVQQERAHRSEGPIPTRVVAGGIAVTAGLILVTVGVRDDERM